MRAMKSGHIVAFLAVALEILSVFVYASYHRC
jgi:hypothetical protein